MATPISERRHVAVLFADLPGFAEASAGLSLEVRQERLDRVLSRLRAAVQSCGGTVDKVVGEGLMAVFGAPVAHEDDALRAVRAALAAARDPELAALGVRSGTNAGEVHWGAVAGDRPTAIGDPVNVAARIHQLAPPREAWVSGAVERAAFRSVRFRPLPAATLRGRTEAVEIFAAEEEIEARPEYRRAWDAAAVMVGRAAELGRLEDLVAAGRGGAVWFEGEAGVGKSRLAYEFRRRLRETGRARTAVGRASLGPGLALSAFADLLHDAAGGAPIREALARAFEGLPAPDAASAADLILLSIGEPVPDAAVRDMDPAQRDKATARAWETWMRLRAPAVMFFDDLEQGDAATIELLEALAARLAGAPVVFVAGARTGMTPPAGFERLLLGPLDPPSALALARDVLGGEPSPALAAFLSEQSGNIPYPLEQLGRYLRAAGLVAGAPLELTGRPDRMPHGLRGLLVARLDALPPDLKETVKAAAVLGRTAWAGLLSKMTGRPAAPALDLLVDGGLLARHTATLLPGDVEYAFRQALLRDAAYSLLPRRERAPLHRAAAEALEAAGTIRTSVLAAGQREGAAVSLPAGSPEAAEALARARDLWLRAADASLADSSLEEAAAAAGEAARLGAGAAGRLVRARAFSDLGRADRAASEAAAVESDASATPEQRARARVVLSLAAHRRGRVEESLRIADSAVPDASGLTLAMALHARAAALSTLARWDEALRCCEEARAAAAGDSREARTLTVGILTIAGYIQTRRGDSTAGIAAFEDCLAVARAARNISALATAWNGLGLVDGDAGEFARSRRCFEIALALRRRTGERSGEGATINNLANLLRRDGENEKALGLYRGALAIAEESGDLMNVASTLINMGLVWSQLDHFDEAVAALQRALSIKRDAGDRRGMAVCLTNLGLLGIDKADLAGARRHVDEALAIRRSIGEHRGLAYSLAMLGNLEEELGNDREAEAAYRESLAFARQVRNVEAEGNALVGIARTCPSVKEAAELLDLTALLPAGPALSEVHASALATRVRLLAMAGSVEARAAAARLIDESPPTRVRQALAALAHARTGDVPGARALLEQLPALPAATRALQRLRALELEAEAREACGERAEATRLRKVAAAQATALGAPNRAARLVAASPPRC